MGNCICIPQGDEASRSINAQINSHIKTDRMNQLTTHRILLLGPGDSGKTTVLKQMRKIHSGTIPEDTIESYSTYIRSKMINYMKILCKESHKLGESLVRAEDDAYDIEESRQYIVDLSPPCEIDDEVVMHLKRLWSNAGIQRTLSQRERFQIPDNVAYFFDERLDDIASDNYIPSFNDYLRIRMRTTGFTEESFTTFFGADGMRSIQSAAPSSDISGGMLMSQATSASEAHDDPDAANTASNTTNNTPQASEYKDLDLEIQNEKKKKPRGVEHTFIFMDVGGQRAERKKWMGMLSDNIEAVVYIIAISEYDLMCFEDSSTYRLTEALNLFETVLDKGFMTGKTVTLFFNKYDLLVEKLRDQSKSTIKDHFQDFPDTLDPRNPDDVCEFVYGLFLERFQMYQKGSNVPHYHKTSALDTNQIQNVMGDIQSDLIRRQLKMAGF